MEAATDPPARGRILIAVAAAILLTGIIAVIAVASSGGDDGRPVVAPPQRCIRSWNADQAARAYGRHNFSYHQYDGALVTHLAADGREVDAGEAGALCAVIFPSRALDPEPFAAGEVLRGRDWIPVSSLEGIALARVAELQLLAAGSPNTTLDATGELAPLSGLG